MSYKYSIKTEVQHSKAVGRSLPISFKQAVVLTHAVRGKPTKQAKEFLTRVTEMKEPVKHFRFNHNIGHRRGKTGPARYPQNAAKHIIQVIESAEANASAKGMPMEKLCIKSIVAQKGPATMRGGRHRGKAKRTHVEVVLQ